MQIFETDYTANIFFYMDLLCTFVHHLTYAQETNTSCATASHKDQSSQGFLKMTYVYLLKGYFVLAV